MREEQELAIAQARKHHAEAMTIAEEERKIRRVQLQVFVHSRFVFLPLDDTGGGSLEADRVLGRRSGRQCALGEDVML